MSEAAAIPYAGETRTGLSQAERVMDIFVAPSKTFVDILRSSSWWLPFLLAAVLSLATAYTVDKRVGFDRVVQNMLHDSPAQEEKIAALEPKQRATQMHMMTTSYRYSTFASPIFILIISIIGALILWASFNFGLGAKTTFGQMLAVWMYASLPRLLVSFIMIGTLSMGGNAEGFDLKNPVGTNLAFYLPNAAPWLRTLLSFIDIVGLWVLVLLVIGTAVVAGVKRGQAAAVVVGWWVLVLIASVGIAAATS